MRHDETRDNTTAIEAAIIEADAREWSSEPDPAGVQLEHRDIAREHDEIVAKARRESRERANGYDPKDPEHDPIGDAETEYDIEYDAEPEDDGQPSEYEEWQDYFGGDEYYDHSENEIW